MGNPIPISTSRYNDIDAVQRKHRNEQMALDPRDGAGMTTPQHPILI